jgi:hypothetical protein
LVNSGYQHEDLRIIDYQIWPLHGLDPRGPAPDFAKPYFSALGAAQVFGRFTEHPFPRIVADEIGLQAFNLGMSGAGPGFFLQRPWLIDMINQGRFAVVQLMSGRSVSNSRYKTGINQGVLIPRAQPESAPVFAETVYQELLESGSPAEIEMLRVENRDVYVREMRTLLARITVPKVLLYWSTRAPDYEEGIGNIGDYWGGFPHFVNREVIDLLRPHAEHYVEVVGARGIPQPLFDKQTGEPILMWPEDRFPRVKMREHNHYYPSPQMNEDVAAALVPICRTLIAAPPVPDAAPPPPRPRDILLHVHIFKNAGSAIDRSLRESFGTRFKVIDPVEINRAFGRADLVEAVLAEPGIAAVASHQIRFPFSNSRRLRIHPIIFLRHPLLRVQSIYDYERMDGRNDTSTAPHTIAANAMDFPEWIEWCLSEIRRSGPVANFQTRICGLTANGSTRDHWGVPVGLVSYQEAVAQLRTAHVGIVEDFERSIARIERRLRDYFPELILSSYVENASLAAQVITERSVDRVEEALGRDLFARLCEANRYDLMLYQEFALS